MVRVKLSLPGEEDAPSQTESLHQKFGYRKPQMVRWVECWTGND